MPTELFDVLDDQGRPTGRVATGREVHEHGLWHRGVNLCITDGRGGIFQQKRGKPPHVRIFPDVWDLFIVADHVTAGKKPAEMAMRELEAKVGVRLTFAQQRSLRQVSVTESIHRVKDPSFPGGYYEHRVFDHNFVVVIAGLDVQRLTLEPNKVLGVRRYAACQLRKDIGYPPYCELYRSHAHRLPDDEILYRTILDAVDGLSDVR